MREIKTHDGRTWMVDLNLKVAYAIQQSQEEFQELVARIDPELEGVQVSLIDTPDDKRALQVLTLTGVLIKMSWFCVRDQSSQILVKDTSEPLPTDPKTGLLIAGVQAPLRPFNEDDYAAGFKGDTVQKVRLVMLQELADFIPTARMLFLNLVELQEEQIKLVAEGLNSVEGDLGSLSKVLRKQQRKEMKSAISKVKKDMVEAVSDLQRED